MEPFRSVRGGGARARLAAADASLLRSLVRQIMSLVESSPADNPVREQDDDLAALEAMLHGPGADEIPEDPVLARLLRTRARRPGGRQGVPPVHRARAAQREAPGRPGDAGHAAGRGGRIQLTQDQALSWLKALNDVRLALGSGWVSPRTRGTVGAAEAGRPAVDRVEVYAWLGAVQESLVQALA